MEYLVTNFNVCSLEEIVERMEYNDVQENSVVITIDDGYRDNYLHAYPILKKYSIPATIFLATNPISDRTILWHDKVFSAFRETKITYIRRFGNFDCNLSLSPKS